MINVHTLIFNDMISQVYTAAKVCVRGKMTDDEERRIKTISNSVGCGHESLLEHTNLITIIEKDIEDSKNGIKEITEFLETLKYLNYRVYYKEKSSVIIISGSIRGYKHIYRNITSLNNPYLTAMTNSIYKTPKYFYKDLIADDILDEKKFVQFEYYAKRKLFIDENGEADYTELDKEPTEDLIPAELKDRISKSKFDFPKVLFYDNIQVVAEEINRLTGLDICLEDLFDFCTITVLFKLSRTAGNQLVRHRNAISQESQRYVAYDKTPFINPLNDIEDELDEDSIGKLGGVKKIMNKQAEECISTYSFLLRNFDSIVKKEDARSILPSNMETIVMMTFTFKSLIQAIELRTAKAAQREIRNNFKTLEKKLKYVVFGDADSTIDLRLYAWNTKNHLYRSISEMQAASVYYSEDGYVDTFDSTGLEDEELTEEEQRKRYYEAAEEANSLLGEVPDYGSVNIKVDNFINSDNDYDKI